MAAPIIDPIVIFIYGLVDPRTGQLRYVGRTKRTLAVRLKAHIDDARKASDRYVHSWIRGLLDDGLKPEVVLLELSDADSWIEAEQFWIEYSRWLGSKLTNLAIGGMGCLGSRWPDEARARQSRERSGENHPCYGRVVPPEQRARQAVAVRAWLEKKGHPRTGMSHTTETKQKIKDGRAKNPPKQTEAGAAAKRAAMLEYWGNPEWRAKQAGKLSGPNHPNYGKSMPISEETKAKLSAAGKGRKFTDEWRRKLSDAARRREAAKRQKACDDESDA